MNKYSLKLVSGFRNSTEVTLEMLEKGTMSASDGYYINQDRYVFADWPYSAELVGEDTDLIEKITFLVNGFPVFQTINSSEECSNE